MEETQPPPKGLGGYAPKLKPRDDLQTLSKRGWGKNWGWRGPCPLPGGLGDVPPENLKRGKLPAPVTPPPSGTQGIGGPSANEGGEKGGPGGVAPWQGAWGMCPQNKTKGLAADFYQPATEWDPKRWQTLSKRGWGKNLGVEGAQPPPRGSGGCAPKTKTKGLAADFYQPAAEWDSKRWQTLSKRGGKMRAHYVRTNLAIPSP